MLDPAPWPSREAWCHARCEATEARLDALPARRANDPDQSLAAALRSRAAAQRAAFLDLVRHNAHRGLGPPLPRTAVISGHLHLRTTLWRHGVRYEEVSLGYPRDWRQDRGIDWYLREILPGTSLHAHRFVMPIDPYR